MDMYSLKGVRVMDMDDNFHFSFQLWQLPKWHSGKGTGQCRHKDRSDLDLGRSHEGRKWQPSALYPDIHGQRSLACTTVPWGCRIWTLWEHTVCTLPPQLQIQQNHPGFKQKDNDKGLWRWKENGLVNSRFEEQQCGDFPGPFFSSPTPTEIWKGLQPRTTNSTDRKEKNEKNGGRKEERRGEWGREERKKSLLFLPKGQEKGEERNWKRPTREPLKLHTRVPAGGPVHS